MRLRKMREDRDLTQETLARHLFTTQNNYSRYENGKHAIPLEMLIRLALFYETSTDYLLELTNERKPYPRKGCYTDGLDRLPEENDNIDIKPRSK